MKKKLIYLWRRIVKTFRIIYYWNITDWSYGHFGDSMYNLGRTYLRGAKVPLHINDRVMIHPVPGKSQATKSYPAVVKPLYIYGRDGRAAGYIWVLTVRGIEDNKDWGGAWINDYCFERLELVSRNYIGND